MKQVHEDSCIPEGFCASGTYSGLCGSRIRLDLAMIVSRTDCSIVTAGTEGVSQYICKALLLHNGMALPEGKRAQEITSEVCQAAAQELNMPAASVSFVANGVKGQYFRPSRIINSLKTLTSKLSQQQSGQVCQVIDNLGDVTSDTVTFEGSEALCHMAGMAADGTEMQHGLCIITTDAAAAPQQIQDALKMCKSLIDTEEYTIIVMANGMSAARSISTGALVQSMERLLKQLGFQDALQACC